jgi:coenzyme F420-0:L-glutamate ligase / coenzyme F420-1:gamma-L-glutamate ligase
VGLSTVQAWALEGLPEVRPGDDLAALLRDGPYEAGDVLVIAHKIVSKAEGALRTLDTVTASERARALAREHAKDPRHVQVILDESAAVLRAERGVLICRTHHGFVCANAGVDTSNAPEDGSLVTLPRDPDASARRLRAALPSRPAVVITDSFGRAWRLGQVDVAIGAAGIVSIDDWTGRPDAHGRELRVTAIAVADAVAAAADLARDKDSLEPAVLVRGLERFVTEADGPGAAALRRPRADDLFR